MKQIRGNLNCDDSESNRSKREKEEEGFLCLETASLSGFYLSPSSSFVSANKIQSDFLRENLKRETKLIDFWFLTNQELVKVSRLKRSEVREKDQRDQELVSI